MICIVHVIIRQGHGHFLQLNSQCMHALDGCMLGTVIRWLYVNSSLISNLGTMGIMSRFDLVLILMIV